MHTNTSSLTCQMLYIVNFLSKKTANLKRIHRQTVLSILTSQLCKGARNLVERYAFSLYVRHNPPARVQKYLICFNADVSQVNLHASIICGQKLNLRRSLVRGSFCAKRFSIFRTSVQPKVGWTILVYGVYTQSWRCKSEDTRKPFAWRTQG